MEGPQLLEEDASGHKLRTSLKGVFPPVKAGDLELTSPRC